AARRGRRGARAGRARSDREEEPQPLVDERRVLVGGRARRRRCPARARARDVRVLTHRGVVGTHPRAEAARRPHPSVGEVRRPGCALAAGCLMAKKQIEVDVDEHGAFNGAELKAQGVLSYDQPLLSTATARSAITYIDGDAGILRYRGYPIEQLAEQK